MIGRGIVLVHGFLDQTQPQSLGIELVVARCIGGDGGQVMDAFEVQQRISPLALAKAEQEKRKRARNTKTSDPEKSNW